MGLISASLIWGAATSIGEAVVGGIIGNRADALAVNNWNQFRENLAAYRPGSNHELQRAIHQAYLQSTLHICADCYHRLGIAAGKKLQLELLPDILADTIRKTRHKAPLGVFSKADEQWLDVVSNHLSDQLKELRSGKFTLPTLDENPELNSLIEEDQLLMQPAGSEQRLEELRLALCERMLTEFSQHFGQTPEIFTSRLLQKWFDYLCACFHHSIKNDQKIANIFQSQLLAKIYIQNETGNREVGISEIESQLEKLSGELADLIRSESSRVISDISDELRGSERRILQAINPQLQQTTGAEPLICHLNLQALIVDRENECRALLDELKKPGGRRVIPITAPGGFGKTSLVIKLLQSVTDGQSITSPDVQALLTLDGRGGDLTLDRIVAEAGRLAGKSSHFQQLFADASLPLADKVRRLLAELSRLGTVWIVLDNFEDQLDGERIKSAEVETFLACGYDGGSRVRLIITTRELPKLDGNRALSTLDEIETGLFGGLPEADALNFLRSEGAACGLDKAPHDLLISFARRVHYIPMALTSVVHYLLDDVYPAVTLADLMKDDGLFADFDRRDYEKGLKRLLENQIARLSPEARTILTALAFFGKTTPQAALEPLFEKSLLARILNSLVKNKLVDAQTDRMGVTRYAAHPMLGELSSLKPAGDDSPINEAYARACHSLATAAYDKARFRVCLDLIECSEKMLRRLVEAGRDELANYLAGALMNKGIALMNLGQLKESIASYDQAIEIRQSLVEAGRDELANGLAMALMNKGNALVNLGQLKEAIASYDQAIEIRQSLVEAGRDELANDLAMALMNKGVALKNLGQLKEAIASYDQAIEMYQSLVEAGRDELANDLAMALMNKGNALQSRGQLKESIASYDQAIEKYQSLVEAGRDELANDLARALMNKGVALESLGQLKEAIASYDQAIEMYQSLVEAGRDELANDLASALMNKGIALMNLGQLKESIASYDQAIEIRQSLVEAGRDELTNGLAMALMNKALALENQEEWDEALKCYREAIRRYLFCVEDDGRWQEYPSLFKTIRLRLMTLVDLLRMEEAKADLELYWPLVENMPDLGALQDVANEQREAIIELANQVKQL